MDSETAAMNAQLGCALRDLRLGRGLTINFVAQVAGMNENTLSRIERGMRPCRVTELDAIAGAFDVDPASLLGPCGARDGGNAA